MQTATRPLFSAILAITRSAAAFATASESETSITLILV
jgi:hypothetical protein